MKAPVVSATAVESSCGPLTTGLVVSTGNVASPAGTRRCATCRNAMSPRANTGPTMGACDVPVSTGPGVTARDSIMDSGIALPARPSSCWISRIGPSIWRCSTTAATSAPRLPRAWSAANCGSPAAARKSRASIASAADRLRASTSNSSMAAACAATLFWSRLPRRASPSSTRTPIRAMISALVIVKLPRQVD